MTDQTSPQAPAVARVTIDDVRTVVADMDPNLTNASKVRALLGGRGSFETIQKHLNTLRQELATAAAPPVAADAVPALPADAAQAMWVAAWTAAQVQTMRRTEALAAERDAARLKLEALSQDVAGLIATVDEQATQLEQAAADRAADEAAHLDELAKMQADQARAAADRADQAAELERTRQELAKTQTEAQHADQLAEQGRQAMRTELGRLTDQIGELKAHLYKRAESAPAT